METILFVTYLIGILLLGAINGVALSHLLQKRIKASFTFAEYLPVQQKLYLTCGPVMGMIEMTASLAILITTILLYLGKLPFTLSLIAYIGTVVVFLLWAILIRPINNLTAKWTEDTLKKIGRFIVP